jgi:hypothetical protein
MKKSQANKGSPTRLGAAPSTEGAPDWVTRMHKHYLKEGYYRPDDLERVLGNPRERLRIKTSDESVLSCKILSK